MCMYINTYIQASRTHKYTHMYMHVYTCMYGPHDLGTQRALMSLAEGLGMGPCSVGVLCEFPELPSRSLALPAAGA